MPAGYQVHLVAGLAIAATLKNKTNEHNCCSWCVWVSWLTQLPRHLKELGVPTRTSAYATGRELQRLPNAVASALVRMLRRVRLLVIEGATVTPRANAHSEIDSGDSANVSKTSMGRLNFTHCK